MWPPQKTEKQGGIGREEGGGNNSGGKRWVGITERAGKKEG